MTRLDRNDPQRGQKKFDSKIKREDRIFDLFARLFSGRLDPHLGCDFVDFQIQRQEDKIASYQCANSENIVLSDLL